MLTQALIGLIVVNAQMAGISPDLAISVAQVESNMNPNAVSPTNDHGLFQLNHNSFPQYTKQELLNPYLNISLGVQYLAKMKQECQEMMEKSWVICYNVGPTKAKTFKHPTLHKYHKKIQKQLKKNKNYKYALDFGDRG